ncbi:MAG: cyclic 2,3-diphosphoglycerate synthase [Proteobacteria bacterium]|nr:cyclic 2,3-diphosphoglycerate synthase [Pseudomonadota bacterium]
MGAAGRDFHNFNVVFRENPDFEVVAFTATQIPNIEGRKYPASLAGSHYPDGIPIHPESELELLITERQVDEVVFSYSDVSYQAVGWASARANAAGADFRRLGTRKTMIASPVPVVAITAVRTGCGKSPTSRFIAEVLRKAGSRVVVVRHPMPYGNLAEQAVQRFGEFDDLLRHNCTFEEREEYESHIAEGSVVYAGVDYGAILAQAGEECDVLIWDGGNNDVPFYQPDVWVTVADPLRPGHENSYYPGEVNVRRADIVVINKAQRAGSDQVAAVANTVRQLNPKATVIRTDSAVTVADPGQIEGKRVLCIEDGPTLTHGGMTFGAAQVAAETFGAAEIVDPRRRAVRSIRATLDKYPHIGKLLPAMGYFPQQIADLEESIRATECDLILIGTPFDLARQLTVDKPMVRVSYALSPIDGEPSLATAILTGLQKRRASSA